MKEYWKPDGTACVEICVPRAFALGTGYRLKAISSLLATACAQDTRTAACSADVRCVPALIPVKLEVSPRKLKFIASRR